LAAWLAGTRSDAEDIVQEAMLRAYKYFDRFAGSAFRPWLLAIVRNTAMTWLKRNRSNKVEFMPDFQSMELADDFGMFQAESPENSLLQRDLAARVNQAVSSLPDEFREVIILRELSELSYKEIAAVTNVPIGTVMSRLSRARRLLANSLSEQIA